MTSSHSSNDANLTMNSAVLPQHLIPVAQSCPEVATMAPSSAIRSRRRPGVVSIALPCLLLMTNSHALSISPALPTTGSSRSLVDQARMIRRIKTDKPDTEKEMQKLSMDTRRKLLIDNDALSAALFDGDFNNSLQSAVANLKTNKNGMKTAKHRAEELDRFMEEDATVAEIVQENIKPGSLVDAVQQSKGADIVDMETLLQKEAADRRKSREAKRSGVEEATISAVSPIPSVKTVRKSRLSSKPLPSKQSATNAKEYKKSALLTREEEYALAYTIQAGAGVHKLRAEYQSSNSQPLSKREWAQLANMSPNDLRKLVSDYRTAKQELVSSNLGLVNAVVRNYSWKAKYKGVPMDELVQEGTLGLIRAAELFDPAKGLRFSTYATIWIKGVLSNSNSLEDVITLPNRERVMWNKIRAAWAEMAAESGQDHSNGRGKPSVASAKELAARLGMKPDLVEAHLRRMACVTNVLSLDYQYTTSTRSGNVNNKQEALMNIAQFGTDADLAEQAQLKADVVSALVRNLTERELTLMRLRYGLEDGKEYTVKECASKMGINRETARVLQHACLKKLREASNMESLQEYLLTVA